MAQEEGNIYVFGKEIIEDQTVGQLKNCVSYRDIGVLTADAHYGYGHPIGGAVAYKDRISLSGVGFDIGCGNKAACTNIRAEHVDVERVMDEIVDTIGFGVGQGNPERVDHPVLDDIRNMELSIPSSKKKELIEKAEVQLGSVGSGNHYVDLFKDKNGHLWIGVHFGSRGFGHKMTMGFIALAKGKSFGDKVKTGGMDSDPILFDADSPTGQDYLHALDLAGRYAYAGRDWVVDKIASILGAEITESVHNHHNFSWKEQHFGEEYHVVRKGCTPAFPGQRSFVGSHMLGASVIIEGLDSEENKQGLYSTVHGAGRVMSRRQAKGKTKWKNMPDGTRQRVVVRKGKIDYDKVKKRAKEKGIVLRGGAADEAPGAYKSLDEVLEYHEDTIRVVERLRPLGVAMEGPDLHS